MFQCIFQNNRVIFQVDYHSRDRAKQLGAYWDVEKKVWYKDLDKLLLDFDGLENLTRELNTAGFDFDSDSAEKITEAISKKEREIEALEAKKTDFNAPHPDGMSVDLFGFQRAGIAFLENLDKALLADQPGLGKTRQAIGWARNHTPVLVICPASMKEHWKREILKARPDSSVIVIKQSQLFYHKKGCDPLELNPDASVKCEWVVINYDVIGDWLAWISTKPFESLIADEGHLIKNAKAQRTTNCLLLSEMIERRLCVTGTPILNRPTEFFTLLQFIGKRTKKDFYWWRKRYCQLEEKVVPIIENGQYKRTEAGGVARRKIQKIIGPKNYRELRAEIRPYYLRRLKKDVLNELPAKTYQNHFIEITNRDEYDEAEKNIVNYIASVSGWEKANKAQKAIYLSKLNTLRQLSVKGKLKATIDILKEIAQEDGDKKAIIFSNFVDGVTALQTKLGSGAVLYTGKDAPQEAVDSFQNDHAIKWFLTTIKKGGVGLNLTAGETVIFMDLPWTPAEKEQAEDRPHRIGQKKNVNIIHVLGENTIDSMLVETLERKQSLINKYVDGIDEDFLDSQVNDTVLDLQKMLFNKYRIC